MSRSQQLRDVAWTLDALTKLTKVLYEPIAAMDAVGAATLEVTVAVSRDSGEPMTPDEAKRLIEWVGSREMQEDLLAWADEASSHD